MRQPFELDGATMPLSSPPASASPSAIAATGRRAAARCRRGAVRGQGAGQEPLRDLPPGDADRDQPPHRRWSSSCARRSRPTVPAACTSRSTASTTCTLVGVEALLRWQHPEPRRDRSPTSSSRILEQTGQIVEVGRVGAERGVRADGRVARQGRRARRSPSTSPAANSTTTTSSSDVRDALEHSGLDPPTLDHRDHRDRADAQRRRDRATPAAQ